MPTTTSATPGGFIGWVLTYGQIVLFFAQIIFWAGVLLFAGYYVATYKRFTNWQMGIGAAGKLREAAEETSPEISVDEFVE